MAWLISRALMEAYENSRSSLGLAADCSQASSLGGEPSAPSKSTATPQAYLLPDKMTAAWKPFRYGITCLPFEGTNGEDLLTWYRAGSHAQTYLRQEPELESTEHSLDCGRKCSGWFARFDRDTSSWRIPQTLLAGDSGLFSETWPRAGFVSCDGRAFQLPSPARLKGGTVSGLLPTCTASDAKRSSNGTTRNRRPCDGLTLTDWLKLNIGQARLNPCFSEWMMLWPIGFTDLKPLETDKFQQWLALHGRR